MRRVPFPFYRGALILLVALGAILLVFGRGEEPASATTFTPIIGVTLADPSPSAHSDLNVSFAVTPPDAQFQSFATFTPSTFDLAQDTAVSDGTIVGNLSTVATLGLLNLACFAPLAPNFTLFDATADVTNFTDSFDATGPGFRDQFLPDPDSPPDADVGATLVPFFALEKYFDGDFLGSYTPGEAIYADIAPAGGDGFVGPGDFRYSILSFLGPFPGFVATGDPDIGAPLSSFATKEPHAENIAPGGLLGPPFTYSLTPAGVGEQIYFDTDGDFAVTIDDVRLSPVSPFAAGTTVSNALTIGMTHYPSYLEDNVPSAFVGAPRSRTLGTANVAGLDVSVTLLTYNPGQLTPIEPLFTADRGFVTISLLNNPGGANIPSPITDFCSTTSFDNTLFGISADNKFTAVDESGQILLTNPDDENSTHVFQLVTKAERDAEGPCDSGPYSCVGDGIDTSLDTCPLTNNTSDDGRTPLFGGDPDGDGIDTSCDPDPGIPGAPSLGFSISAVDVDADGYNNRGDICPQIPNGLAEGPDGEFGTPDDVPIGTNNQEEGAINFASDPFMPASLKTPLVGAVGPLLAIGFDEVPPASPSDGGPRVDNMGADCDDSDRDGTADIADFDDDGDGIPDTCDVGGGPLAFPAASPAAAFNPGIAAYCSGLYALLGIAGPGGGSTTATGPGIANGHTHIEIPTVPVTIGEHGAELEDLNGPDEVASGGSAVYTVGVKNESKADSQDIEVALRVLPAGCATVNGVLDQNSGEAAAVGPKASDSVSFTVDWSACADANYTVEADACHVGDVGAGFYGVDDCPGALDGHGTDSNPLDDAPVSVNVEVGPFD